MAVADCNGLPVSVCIESATPHEVTLATSTLLQMVVPDPPQNLIGDNAYDSDRLDAELSFYGIQLIAPHRRNRFQTSEQEGAEIVCATIEFGAGMLNPLITSFPELLVLPLDSLPELAPMACPMFCTNEELV
ncbi:hypothetical protein [Edaphobacter modestus]|uniref:DDE family transposase n=1 Tax=Edaphobacter modestus TaxID=388466 RepID=A0A4Q7Z1G8_9BACT|nr:hypothetical protein [Edaphobacter modestus]RZU43724.1 hypothetical protein BDD14_5427 [Edaphobacter modestus]